MPVLNVLQKKNKIYGIITTTNNKQISSHIYSHFPQQTCAFYILYLHTNEYFITQLQPNLLSRNFVFIYFSFARLPAG